MISDHIYIIIKILVNYGQCALWKKDLTYEGESIYNYLQVYETESKVALSTNVLFGVQSVCMKEDGLTGMYYDYAMAEIFRGYADRGRGDRREDHIAFQTVFFTF